MKGTSNTKTTKIVGELGNVPPKVGDGVEAGVVSGGTKDRADVVEVLRDAGRAGRRGGPKDVGNAMGSGSGEELVAKEAGMEVFEKGTFLGDAVAV